MTLCVPAGSAQLAAAANATKQREEQVRQRQRQRVHFENAFWMPFSAFLNQFDMVLFAAPKGGGGGRELISVFGDCRACLVPGVRNRLQFVQAHAEADKFAMELIQQEVSAHTHYACARVRACARAQTHVRVVTRVGGEGKRNVGALPWLAH